MRGCLGVAVGMVVGAALAFSLLVVGALVERSNAACPTPPQADWLIRVQVPWETVREQVASEGFSLPLGRLEVSSVGPAACDGVLLRGNWVGDIGSVGGLGLEFRLAADSGEFALRPISIRVGAFAVPVSWMPDAWVSRVMGPYSVQLQGALRSQLQSPDLQLCRVGSSDGGLELSLCGE